MISGPCCSTLFPEAFWNHLNPTVEWWSPLLNCLETSVFFEKLQEAESRGFNFKWHINEFGSCTGILVHGATTNQTAKMQFGSIPKNDEGNGTVIWGESVLMLVFHPSPGPSSLQLLVAYSWVPWFRNSSILAGCRCKNKLACSRWLFSGEPAEQSSS